MAGGNGVTNWKAVSPENRRKIDPIVRHYMGQAHPFTACVADNTKRFGKDRAERICAVVKDMGARTTKWRKGAGKAVKESPADDATFVEGLFDEVFAPVLEAEGVTVEELADWSKMAADAGVLETPKPKRKPPARKRAARRAPAASADPLALKVETGDLALLETAANPGVTRYGHANRASELPGNQAPKRKPRRTRTGQSSEYDASKHPRGRSGEWTVKQGDSGDTVRVIQRRVGAKSDGQFGAQTRQRIMDFQRKHGLKVDGVVGRQTIAAMRGDTNALHVSPGSATRADRRWLVARAAMRRVRETPMPESLRDLRFDENLNLVETPDLEIHEQAALTLVETPAGGQSALLDLALLESAADGEVKFNPDGTIDMVLIRPCNGRGVGNRIYESEMLRQFAPTFAGLAMYDNHESPAATRARQGIPRAPSELAGEIRESWFDEAFTTPDDDKMDFGQGAVIGRVMLTEDAEKLVRRLPRQIKTSINSEATGLRPGSRRGKRGVLVEGFVNDPDKHSVDLVTRAGAGGAVASLYRDLAAA